MQQRLADDIGTGRTTATAIEQEITRSPHAVAEALNYALTKVQIAVLENYRASLNRSSRQLSQQGAWQFLAEKRAEARKYGVESELERLVLLAAGDFMSSRMVKIRRVVGVQRSPE